MKSKNPDITLFGYTNQMSTEKSYEIIPCNLYEHDKKIMNETNRSRMNLFIKNARKIMSQNVNIPEFNCVKLN